MIRFGNLPIPIIILKKLVNAAKGMGIYSLYSKEVKVFIIYGYFFPLEHNWLSLLSSFNSITQLKTKCLSWGMQSVMSVEHSNFCTGMHSMEKPGWKSPLPLKDQQMPALGEEIWPPHLQVHTRCTICLIQRQVFVQQGTGRWGEETMWNTTCLIYHEGQGCRMDVCHQLRTAGKAACPWHTWHLLLILLSILWLRRTAAPSHSRAPFPSSALCKDSTSKAALWAPKAFMWKWRQCEQEGEGVCR